MRLRLLRRCKRTLGDVHQFENFAVFTLPQWQLPFHSIQFFARNISNATFYIHLFFALLFVRIQICTFVTFIFGVPFFPPFSIPLSKLPANFYSLLLAVFFCPFVRFHSTIAGSFLKFCLKFHR